jgi:predicted transcriptional regulator
MAGKSGKESKKNKPDLGDVLTELATLRQEIDARLIETLLTQGPQTPPQLGEAVGLATGSLYHHLREIVAAGIAIVEAKHYRLTPEGERLARVFFLAS